MKRFLPLADLARTKRRTAKVEKALLGKGWKTPATFVHTTPEDVLDGQTLVGLVSTMQGLLGTESSAVIVAGTLSTGTEKPDVASVLRTALWQQVTDQFSPMAVGGRTVSNI